MLSGEGRSTMEEQIADLEQVVYKALMHAANGEGKSRDLLSVVLNTYVYTYNYNIVISEQ